MLHGTIIVTLQRFSNDIYFLNNLFDSCQNYVVLSSGCVLFICLGYFRYLATLFKCKPDIEINQKYFFENTIDKITHVKPLKLYIFWYLTKFRLTNIILVVVNIRNVTKQKAHNNHICNLKEIFD